jgi:ribosomal protein L40E
MRSRRKWRHNEILIFSVPESGYRIPDTGQNWRLAVLDDCEPLSSQGRNQVSAIDDKVCINKSVTSPDRAQHCRRGTTNVRAKIP